MYEKHIDFSTFKGKSSTYADHTKTQQLYPAFAVGLNIIAFS